MAQFQAARDIGNGRSLPLCLMRSIRVTSPEKVLALLIAVASLENGLGANDVVDQTVAAYFVHWDVGYESPAVNFDIIVGNGEGNTNQKYAHHHR